MKILFLSIVCTLFGCAHVNTAPDSIAYHDLEWSWIPSHRARGGWVKGHWSHPENGSYYRKKSQGPPHSNWSPTIDYPGQGWAWSRGYWERSGFKREWIDGQWIESARGEE